MRFFDTVEKKLCTVNFTAKNKDDAIRRISDIASQSAFLKQVSKDRLYAAFQEREELGSTGLAHGIAIPHARIRGLERFVTFFVISDRGILYDAIDKKKTTIFCVIVGPEEQVNEHLKMLAYFSRILNNGYFRKEILKVRNSDLVYETIAIYGDDPQVRIQTDRQEKQKLLVLILYNDDFIYDILEFFVELGIDGATVVGSSGMGSYISNIPIFASFLGFMKDKDDQSRTILATFPESLQNRVILGIESVTGDLDKRQGAMIIITDIAYCKGSMKFM